MRLERDLLSRSLSTRLMDFYRTGISIAFVIHSVDRSVDLSVRLIAPTVWDRIKIFSRPNAGRVQGSAMESPPILDELP